MQNEWNWRCSYFPWKYSPELHILTCSPISLMPVCKLSCLSAFVFCWDNSLKILIVIILLTKDFQVVLMKWDCHLLFMRSRNGFFGGSRGDLSLITLETNTCSLILVYKYQNSPCRYSWLSFLCFNCWLLQSLLIQKTTPTTFIDELIMSQYETFPHTDENTVF